MQVDLNEIMKKNISVGEYIDKMAKSFKKKFLEKKRTYHLDEEVIHRLKDYAKDVAIVVFTAQWCEYCADYIPVLDLLSEKTSIKVKVFGGLKTNPLHNNEIWRIPPSPPEVKTFDVQEIPHIIIFNKQGKQLGTITGSQKLENTLEKEILHIIQQK